jgi:hypothetical protein
MQGTGSNRDATTASFEILENRVLFSRINVADFGADPRDGRDDRAAIQAAINASDRGDTIAFDAGTYNVSGPLKFKSSRVYTGAFTGARGTTLDFDNTQFGVHLDGDASDVVIKHFTFAGGGIDMGSGGTYRDVQIVGNTFRDIGSNAVRATNASDGLRIDSNIFKNVNGYGAFEVYNASRFSFQYNRVTDSRHGGHLIGPLDDCDLSHNYMTGLTDWGLEIQRSGQSVSRNMLVEDNVIFGFRRAYGNTGGLSVIAEHGINTIVRDNYIRADHPGVDLEEGHMHVGIEAGFDSGVVEGNVIGGDRANGNLTHYITASGPDMLFRNNKFYGKPQWQGETSRWAGNVPGGMGWFREENNSRDDKLSHMPDPRDPRSSKPSSRPDDDINGADDDDNAGNENTAPKPPAVAAFADGDRWLSDLEWDGATNGWGPVERDQTNGERDAGDGAALSMDGHEYAKGLGVAVNSRIVYSLDGKYDKFFSDIGIDDYAGEKGSVTFEIWLDGHKVYDSGRVTHRNSPRAVAIDVSGAQTLTLVTTDAGDGGNSDHADWAGARLRPADNA